MQISLGQDFAVKFVCLKELILVQFVSDTFLFRDRFEAKQRHLSKKSQYSEAETNTYWKPLVVDLSGS